MSRFFVVNSIFMAVFMTASSARAAECTIDRGVVDTVLRKASSCIKAYRVFESCSSGASGDVPLGTIVQEKCESGFVTRLDAAKRAAYKKQLAACEHKYAKQAGSMYRSFERSAGPASRETTQTDIHEERRAITERGDRIVWPMAGVGTDETHESSRRIWGSSWLPHWPPTPKLH